MAHGLHRDSDREAERALWRHNVSGGIEAMYWDLGLARLATG